MKILTVFTGGTIASSEDDHVLKPSVKNAKLLLEMYSRMDTNVEFKVDIPYTILSENLTADHLEALKACIKKHKLQKYDGVIIVQGTDTIQYTAAYLSYIFGIHSLPIVMVSANYPLSDERSNGWANFCAAVDFIKAKHGNGVFVCYGNSDGIVYVHRGTALLPHTPYSDEIYSIYGNVFGRVENEIFSFNQNFVEKDDEADLSSCEPNGKVIIIKPYVGMTYPEIPADAKAILLETYHSGTLNTSNATLRSFCEKAKELDIPVFLTGNSKGFEYESKLAYDELKIRVLPAASPIAMYMKLWLLEKNSFDKLFLPVGGDIYYNN